MNAHERQIAAQLIERFISHTRSECDRVSMDAKDRFEIKAWEEVLAGLLVAETAAGRASRIAECYARADEQQKARLSEQLESSIREKGIQLGVPR